MINNIKITVGILIVLSASRFIPHPPNFTSLIALSFYIPAIFGRKYIAAVIFSFFLTDLIIGFHSVTFFTWGSVLIIGLMAKYFKNVISMRIFGPLLGALIFFIITNFGVWTQGSYGYSIEGLIACYYMAIPFFHYTIISTIIFSIIIEVACGFSSLKVFRSNKK
tara:strand:+ start:255 stop:749 length:495 start_codon:yes stop_codon:yes gene_type:complete